MAIFYVPAYAKINLYCDVWPLLNENEAAYHKMDTLMHRINLYDDCFYKASLRTRDFKSNHSSSSENIQATVNNLEKRGYEIFRYRYEKTNIYLVLNTIKPEFTRENNSFYKAFIAFWQAYLEDLGSEIEGDLLICVKKNIPSFAGLGGASADASSLLHFLYFYFFGLEPKNLVKSSLLDKKQELYYQNLARKIGKDCFYQLVPGSYRMIGEGDIIADKLEDDLNLPLYLYLDTYKQSTKEAFYLLDTYVKDLNNELHLKSKFSSNKYLLIKKAISERDMEKLAGLLNNSFTFVISHFSELQEVFKKLENYSAHLTGSGSSFFFLPLNKNHSIEELLDFKEKNQTILSGEFKKLSFYNEDLQLKKIDQIML